MDEHVRSHGVETKYRGSKHHHHSRRKKSNKVFRFIKKYRSVVINVVVIVMALAAVITIGIWGDKKRNSEQIVPPAAQESVSDTYNGTSIQVQVPFYSREINLVSNPVITYMRSDVPVSAPTFFDTFRPNDERLDIGLPMSLAFDVKGIPAEYTVVSSIVEVSDRADLQNPRMFTLKSDERSVDIYHLKSGVQYYYRISITFSNSSVTSVQGSFETAQFPRVLSIDGAVNVRDIGGWETVDGKTVRQGLLYRGSELDGAVESSFCVTEKGRDDMLTVLGISTDMDLRSPSDNTRGTHALGANVSHSYYDAPMYGGIFASPEKVRTIFSDLADPGKYPVYLHCTYGMDRTGTFCYLLEALLGVDEDDLMRDYQLTALYYSALNSDAMNAFIEQLRLMEGDTVQDKVTGYLLSIGVTEDEITSIKRIFLE